MLDFAILKSYIQYLTKIYCKGDFMKESIKEMMKGIRLNSEYISRIRKSKETLKYMNSLDFESMPSEIKEMNLSIIERAKKTIEERNESLLNSEEGFEGEEFVVYAESFSRNQQIISVLEDLKCLKCLLEKETPELTSNVRNEIEMLTDRKNDELEKLRSDFKAHVERSVAKELFDEGIPKEETPPPERAEMRSPSLRSYSVKKSTRSIAEIKEIIDQYIRLNEHIFNKIIFESRPPTISIAERMLDLYFKPGTGYIINFISEPDTNYGKFYRNLLNVFSEIKEFMFDNHDIVVIPEEGKSISYLNSFYQNYVFVREKIDTALTQFKLQNSLLNENFSVKYMIFEKIAGKYLVFFNGNIGLSRAVEQYFVNQAKLGTMQFEVEFVEYKDSINKMIAERLNRIRNRIDLSSADNYMKLNRITDGTGKRSLLFDVSGVKVLIDPEAEYEGNDIDIVVMTNARGGHTDFIPGVMSKNPSAKLFTSDISFKIARIKWLKDMNNPSLIPGAPVAAGYSKRDIESLNDRIIRITPMGKGYNFKNLVNIKFFNSGSVPGSAVVEIRDACSKTLYAGILSTGDTSLLKASDAYISEYDFIYSESGTHYEYVPLQISALKDKLREGKQVFIFSDTMGNLQHIVAELYSSGINRPVISGDPVFDSINREISKMLGFGSSWGDNFIEREKFSNSISMPEPFADEYEFYKKFSTGESMIFILPFDKMEIEMIIKNKLYGDNLIFVPADFEEEFLQILKNDPVVPDEMKTGKHVVYNYIRSSGPEDLYSACSENKQFKKMICGSQVVNIPANKILIAGENSEKKVY